MIEMDESSRGSAASETKGLRGNFQECLNLEMDNELADREERPQQKSTADTRNFGQIIQQQHSLPNGYSPSGITNDKNSPSSTSIEPNSSTKKGQPNSVGTKESSNTAASEAAAETKNQISGTAIDQQEDQQLSTINSKGTANSDEQLSPNSLSLRRSSRVSALNAKKKLQQSSQSQIGGNKEKEQQPSGTLLTILQPVKTEVKNEPQATPQSTTENKTSTPEMVQEHQIHGIELVSNLQSAVPLPNEENSQHVRVSALKKKLKRKLDDGIELDQYDCKFGIRLDAQGDVVMMSDDSEISSLNEEQVADLKERFENAQKQEVSGDIQTQRELQIAELESILRLEEAKLLMMKKLRQSQQLQDGKKQQDGIRKLVQGVGQNSSGQAYKPKVAVISQQMQQQNTALAAKMNGTTHSGGGKKGKGGAVTKSTGSDASIGLQGLAGAAAGGGIQLSTLPPQHLQVIQQLYERLSQNPQQMANLIKTLPHPTGQALTELLRQYAVAQASGGVTAGQHQQSGGGVQHTAKSMTSSAAHSHPSGQSNQPLSQVQIDAANKQARELTQQNIAKARQQLRRELEQMVTTKLPLPKAPPPDLQFIPNGNQPEFAYLLGLDLTVQRVLKDKQMFRKPDFLLYQCEECETDFTTSWKAICGENEDYHLYCERCVRQAQKRKICQDNKNLLTRAFQQIKEREKEFERQVSAGKYNVEPVFPTPQVAPAQSNKVSQQQNILSNAATTAALSQSGLKGPAAAALQQFSQQNAATAALNLSKSGSTASGGGGAASTMVNAAIKNASTASGQHQQKTTSSATTGGSRRSTNATASNANNSAAINSNQINSSAGANPLAALFQQNPLMQQQFAAMAALSNTPILRQLGQLASNPMMLAAMAQNPMILQQLFQSAAQNQRSQQQQNQNTTTTTSSNTNASIGSNIPAGAAAALAQLAQKSNQVQQQQSHQQQHRSSASSSVHHQTTTSASNTQSSTTNASSNSNSNANNQSQQLAAAMVAYMMNPSAASNPIVQLSQLGSQNPQILSQLSSHPQFRQVMQMYMQQQMKAAGGKK